MKLLVGRSPSAHIAMSLQPNDRSLRGARRDMYIMQCASRGLRRHFVFAYLHNGHMDARVFWLPLVAPLRFGEHSDDFLQRTV